MAQKLIYQNIIIKPQNMCCERLGASQKISSSMKGKYCLALSLLKAAIQGEVGYFVAASSIVVNICKRKCLGLDERPYFYPIPHIPHIDGSKGPQIFLALAKETATRTFTALRKCLSLSVRNVENR